MNEPIYEYVKGQGWTIRSTKYVLTEMNCGTKVRIEARPPTRGELFLRAANWAVDKEPDLDAFVEWLDYYETLSELITNRTLDVDKDWILRDETCALVTVIPL